MKYNKYFLIFSLFLFPSIKIQPATVKSEIKTSLTLGYFSGVFLPLSILLSPAIGMTLTDNPSHPNAVVGGFTVGLAAGLATEYWLLRFLLAGIRSELHIK